VYLDPRLWALTAGVRGRIAATVLVGLAAVAAGIARLALLGWLLGRVLTGESAAAITDLEAAQALAATLRSGPDGGTPVDAFAMFNTLSIVLGVDTTLVTTGGPIVGVWASTNK